MLQEQDKSFANVLHRRRNSIPDSHGLCSSHRPLIVTQKIHFAEPIPPSRRPFYKKRWSGVFRSASRDSILSAKKDMQAILSARKEGSPSPSDTASINSTGKLKNKVKNAFKGRLKSTSSAGNLTQTTPLSPTVTRPNDKRKDNNTGNRIEHELELTLTFLMSLPKSGKLEMLGGTADAVFNDVLKALDAHEHKVEKHVSAKVNSCLKALLCWVDGLLLNEYNLGTCKDNDKSDPLTVGAKLCDDLKKSVANLWCNPNCIESRLAGSRLSADSGNQSIMEDSVTSSSSISPPPKPPHPSVVKNKWVPPIISTDRKNPPGRRYVTECKTDSGIFTGNESSGTDSSPSDFNGNHVFPPKTPETITEREDLSDKSCGRLFSEGSLDDLLSKLSGVSNSNNSNPIPFDAPDCHTIDSSQKEHVQSNQLHSRQVTVDNCGRQITTTRMRTSKQVIRQAVTTTTSSSSSSLPDEDKEDILRRLERLGPGGELKTCHVERVHLQSGASHIFHDVLHNDEAGRLSPYDNTTAHIVANRPPPIPPRTKQTTPPVRPPKKNTSLSEAIKDMDLIDSSGEIHIVDQLPPEIKPPGLPAKFPVNTESSWSKQEQREVNKRSEWSNGVEQVNSLSTTASKSTSMLNGKLLAQVHTYSKDEDGFWHPTKDLYPDAPPLPPRRKNVMNYVRILGPGKLDETADDDVPAEGGDMELASPVPLQLTTNFKSFSLSSYVVLRDKWKEHEQRQSVTDMSLAMPSLPSFQNLSELIIWPDNSFKLPRALSQKSSNNNKTKKAINFVERLALPSSEILTSLDASDWLILRQKTPDSPEEVRGGPVDALIVHSTLPGPQVLLYQEAFLTTYRTFITPYDLISKLVWRYDALMGTNADKPSLTYTKTAKNTLSILVRVVDELSPSEISSKLLEEVNSFQYRLIDQNQLSLSRVLRQRILDRVEFKAGFKTAQPLFDNPPPSPSYKKEPNFHDQKAECLAVQLTCMDSQLFQNIELSELIWWAQEQCEEKSPNLSRFTEHFNQMSFWIRSRVLLPTEQKEREKIFLKFIKIMKCLRQVGNFNSYLAILSALDSGPVRRLDWSSNIMESMKEHSRVMDSSSSFKIYRQLLADTPPPCLPYLGLILQDLTFVHIGNPDSLPPELCAGRADMINFVKRWQQYAILDSVRRFKSWPYSYKKDDEKCSIFGNFTNFLTEDETWELSEKIKPRNRTIGAKRLYVPS